MKEETFWYVTRLWDFQSNKFSSASSKGTGTENFLQTQNSEEYHKMQMINNNNREEEKKRKESLLY